MYKKIYFLFILTILIVPHATHAGKYKPGISLLTQCSEKAASADKLITKEARKTYLKNKRKKQDAINAAYAIHEESRLLCNHIEQQQPSNMEALNACKAQILDQQYFLTGMEEDYKILDQEESHLLAVVQQQIPTMHQNTSLQAVEHALKRVHSTITLTERGWFETEVQ